MKTKKIRLLVTMITLAAVIIIGTAPATAQRRSTQGNNTETREQKNNNEQKSTVQSRNNSNNGRTTSTVNKSANVQNRQATPAQRNTNVRTETNNRVVSTQENTNTQRRETATPQVNRNPANTNKNATVNNNNERNRNVEQNRNNASTNNRPENNTTRRDNSTSYSSGSEYSRNVNNPEARRTTENARRIYRLDENDSRYTPNNNFKGNNQNWSNNYRPGNMNYNHNDRNFYRNYNYWSYKHWDRSLESYRWNFYSWRDYYSGYNPYSYRFHRNYVFHPRYGHVIKRFVVRPIIFSHNSIRYYCYDGHFFRHHRGVGYVLVDIPYGIVFNTLPYEYERVYINGYMYFRIGNLFFEHTNFGFSLVHYPERYFALNNGFNNGGYYFNDDIYW